VNAAQSGYSRIEKARADGGILVTVDEPRITRMARIRELNSSVKSVLSVVRIPPAGGRRLPASLLRLRKFRPL
jgi:hypothetical protein